MRATANKFQKRYIYLYFNEIISHPKTKVKTLTEICLKKFLPYISVEKKKLPRKSPRNPLFFVNFAQKIITRKAMSDIIMPFS